MNKLKTYAYSHIDFNNIMNSLGYLNDIPNYIAVISICSKNDEDSSHRFENSDNILNIDFDDVDPNQWWDEDHYDDAFEGYISKTVHDVYFNTKYENVWLHALDYKQAGDIVNFIERNINEGVKEFYIHCSAGLSRSQGIVRYILDAYSDKYDIEIRKENPCMTPNMHVVRMLKRISRYYI